MKKLLILTLVLGMASMASGSIVLVNPAGTPTINIVGDGAEESASFFFVADSGDVDAGTMVYPGTLASIIDQSGETGYPDMLAACESLHGLTAVSGIDLVGFFDGTYPPASTEGTLATYTALTTVDVYLLSTVDFSMVSSAMGVPEPMTIALLGLGGLFLLRRRK